MTEPAGFEGRVVSGRGQGATFTRLDWVREQLLSKLGIDPYPGTLNLILDRPSDLEQWAGVKSGSGISLTPPDSGWCHARFYPVRVGGRVRAPGAIIVPEVVKYPEAQVEIIAAHSLRNAFSLADGDRLQIQLIPPATVRALAYLGEHNVLSLATVGPRGLWAAAVFYVNADFTLYFLSSSTSRHCLNLQSQATICGTIQEDYENWFDIKGIQFEGQAVPLVEPEREVAIRLYGTKFPIIANPAQAPAEIEQALRQIEWYKIVPSSLYFIDNSMGLGHRDKILLDENG